MLRLTRTYLILCAALAGIQWIYINWFGGKDLKTWNGYDQIWHPFYFSFPQAIFLCVTALTTNLVIMRRWGGMRSQLGRAVLFLSLGIVMWGGVGNLIFFVKETQADSVPYPWWADLGYVGLLPMYALGLYSLSKVIAIDWRTALKLAWVPLLVAAATAWLTVPLPHWAHGHEWVLSSWSDLNAHGTFFGLNAAEASLLYLTSDIVVFSWALVLLLNVHRSAGGMLYPALMTVVVSLVALYFGDLMYDQRIAAGTYYTGDIASFFYGLSLYLMSFAILAIGVVERHMNAQAVTVSMRERTV